VQTLVVRLAWSACWLLPWLAAAALAQDCAWRCSFCANGDQYQQRLLAGFWAAAARAPVLASYRQNSCLQRYLNEQTVFCEWWWASSAQANSRLAERLPTERRNQNKWAAFWRVAAARAPGMLAMYGRHSGFAPMAFRVQGASGAWRARTLTARLPASDLHMHVESAPGCLGNRVRFSRCTGVGAQETPRARLR